jgi:competence protein ComEA
MPLVWGKNKPGKKNETGGFLILLLAVLALNGLMSVTRSGSSVPRESPCENPVVIQVDGEVRSPGIYTFCRHPDLQALLERAGGPGASIRPPHPWPLQTVSSGLKVLFQNDGTEFGCSIMEMSAFTKMTLGLPISLNRENEEGLTALPGVGPAMARAIVREREKRGGFKALEEVKDVEGVGEMLLEKIRPFVIL